MALIEKTVQRTPGVAQKRHPGVGATPHAPAGTRFPGRVSARAVGSFVPKLTRTAFEKFGFSTAALLTDWAQIVGPQLAATTTPDRIRWPKSPDQLSATGGKGPRAGATLHISVDPARALDVQYKSGLIVDRINAYFGYRAVADLRIVQAPIAAVPPLVPRPRAPSSSPPDAQLGLIADDGLRAAFERMQSGMRARRG